MFQPPLRILYWNVSKLSSSRFIGVDNNDALLAPARQEYFRRTVQEAQPDIIVLVEIAARTDFAILDGSLLNNQQSIAVLNNILLWLRAQPDFAPPQNPLMPPNPMIDWCLVPPLNLGAGGQREAVAVFYRGSKFIFTGPWIFNPDRCNRGGRSLPPDNMPLGAMNITEGDYPAAWNFCFLNPAAPRTINIGPYNIGLNENQVAGQYLFTRDGNYRVWRPIHRDYEPSRLGNHNDIPNEIYFPIARNGTVAQSRAPFLVTFQTLEQGQGRTIKICAVHASPANAINAVTNLGEIVEINDNNPNNELRIVLGDFNVDAYQDLAYLRQGFQNGYGPLLNNDYVMCVWPFTQGNIVFDNNPLPYEWRARPFSLTHLMQASTIDITTDSVTQYRATPFGNSFPANARPEDQPAVVNIPGSSTSVRGYLGSSFGGLSYEAVIDNVFVRFGANFQNVSYIILNAIAGQAYYWDTAAQNVVRQPSWSFLPRTMSDFINNIALGIDATIQNYNTLPNAQEYTQLVQAFTQQANAQFPAQLNQLLDAFNFALANNAGQIQNLGAHGRNIMLNLFLYFFSNDDLFRNALTMSDHLPIAVSVA